RFPSVEIENAACTLSRAEAISTLRFPVPTKPDAIFLDSFPPGLVSSVLLAWCQSDAGLQVVRMPDPPPWRLNSLVGILFRRYRACGRRGFAGTEPGLRWFAAGN